MVYRFFQFQINQRDIYTDMGAWMKLLANKVHIQVLLADKIHAIYCYLCLVHNMLRSYAFHDMTRVCDVL